ncbi:HAMP domain-containing histidine kinase [Microbispora sp. RL4-1S]|uniref:histidine kinase n=1 Tax=Microbispora oryzae TaxID=2806554 RepID=A0A941AKE7_9ACTN|nr:HAMP domain-containing sensor histidine kinase [Microbispora oryzae]MBP2707126.1 HAMP domain-containing histidine kinase [Microbispora oryzae]
MSVPKTTEQAEQMLRQVLSLQRQFVADASHELLTPIAGIRAHLEAARLYPEDLREAIDGALTVTSRLERIVADLLLLADIGSACRNGGERIDLGRLAADELHRHRGSPKPIAELAEGVVVRGVRPLLSRVVAALVDNAERHAATTIRVTVRREGREALLEVSNDGETIPLPERERIFDRFYRRDPARSRNEGGSGLGLAIVREVVTAFDGRITVEDAEPGSRFVVCLPLAPGRGTACFTRPAGTRGEVYPAPSPVCLPSSRLSRRRSGYAS